MVFIRFASHHDIPFITELAYDIWPKTYESILSSAQITFMLNDMYSHESLLRQFKNGHLFLIALKENRPVGFASFSVLDSTQRVYKIHKLYLLPAVQGKRLGKQLVNFIEDDIRLKGAEVLEVNVNRNNPALNFYLKSGFEISREVDIPYHQFVINDYVMRKKL
ncbi:MAG TPA: GNAT family N-acetyltransferase [Pedobacter sp.]|jgi:ribosomal protein S18 acetylase RimI-like enzyme